MTGILYCLFKKFSLVCQRERFYNVNSELS